LRRLSLMLIAGSVLGCEGVLGIDGQYTNAAIPACQKVQMCSNGAVSQAQEGQCEQAIATLTGSALNTCNEETPGDGGTACSTFTTCLVQTVACGSASNPVMGHPCLSDLDCCNATKCSNGQPVQSLIPGVCGP
jgi:hypothetical protein